MATLRPFRALRPRPDVASRVAAVPYDVVTTEEARAQADDNPLSFLRVSRPELELPPDTDPYSDEVYARAVRNFERLKQAALVLEDEPSVYLYRLRSGNHEQTGLAACYSLDEYDRGIIKKHERTRRDKEDDRTRHMIALGAQTGPVFLVYRASDAVDEIATRQMTKEPLFDFEAADGVRHTLWAVSGAARDALVVAFAGVPSLYIADGHHRAASAARARQEIGEARLDEADPTTFLAVAFPHEQARILPYNRIVKDLGPVATVDFLEAVRSRFEVSFGTGDARDTRRDGDVFRGSLVHAPSASASRRQRSNRRARRERASRPAARTGPEDWGRPHRQANRFHRGGRGTGELERLVDSGKAAVAFSLFPVSIADLMAVADAGAIMPPKSTWFEPKLRDGLLIHLI